MHVRASPRAKIPSFGGYSGSDACGSKENSRTQTNCSSSGCTHSSNLFRGLAPMGSDSNTHPGRASKRTWLTRRTSRKRVLPRLLIVFATITLLSLSRKPCRPGLLGLHQHIVLNSAMRCVPIRARALWQANRRHGGVHPCPSLARSGQMQRVQPIAPR